MSVVDATTSGRPMSCPHCWVPLISQTDLEFHLRFDCPAAPPARKLCHQDTVAGFERSGMPTQPVAGLGSVS